MPELSPVTALGAVSARSVNRGALALQENSDLALASLAIRRGAPWPVPFGLDLPGPGAWKRQGAVSVLWTGVDQWLVEGHGLAATDFAAELGAKAPGCSVTEQTDGFVAFEIRSTEGEAPILTLLSKLVNLDPERFGPGAAVRTGLEHLSVHLIRRASDHLAVVGMRSSAETLWHALENAMARLDRRRASGSFAP